MMVAWIGASPSQRFWHYIVPAARRSIESGEYDSYLRTLEAKATEVKTAMAELKVDTFRYRAHERRLEQLRRDYRDILKQRRDALATLAEADRRKAYRASNG